MHSCDRTLYLDSTENPRVAIILDDDLDASGKQSVEKSIMDTERAESCEMTAQT